MFGSLNFPPVTVGTSLTTLCDHDATDVFSAGFTIENTGATAFNAFEVQTKAHPDESTWTTLASAAGDFSTVIYPLLRALGAPVTLAGGARAALLISTTEISRVRLRASVATGNTTARARVSGK